MSDQQKIETQNPPEKKPAVQELTNRRKIMPVPAHWIGPVDRLRRALKLPADTSDRDVLARAAERIEENEQGSTG
jgi:hypothetical protein